MNKKGFTLVELLAVIAILAILVIIALPNVLEIFNRVKKELFLTEVKNVYKEVSKKYITENMKGKKLSNINSRNNSKLDISGDNLEYCINLDNSGTIKTMVVRNDNYFVEYNDSEDITNYSIEKVKETTERTKLICSKSKIKVIEGPASKKCTSGKTLTNGVTYEDGTYTYTYNNYQKTWSVVLTDKESTSPVTETPCSVIDNYPLVSTKSMFEGSKTTSIDVTNFDTSNVTNMYHMFRDCGATKIIGLEYLNTSNVTDMGMMFDRSGFEILDLTGFDTRKVKNMSHMFFQNKALSLNISDLDTSNITEMYEFFYYSQATEIVGLEYLDTSNVTSMQGMFMNSSALSLDLSSFDTTNVTSMAGMFYGSQATEIKGLENFSTSNVTKMNGMFQHSKVEKINLSSFDTSNVTSMNSMFYNSKATEIKGLKNFNTSKVTDMGGMFRWSSVPNLDLSSFDTSNVTDMNNMFLSSKVTDLNVTSFNTTNVTNMVGTFSGIRLEQLDLRSFDIDNTDISYIFNGTIIKKVLVKNQTDLEKYKNSGSVLNATKFVLVE